MIAVAYGAGTDSTAMLVELVERRQHVDVITFADTGGERPETYAYVTMFSAWLVERGYPPIVTVKNDGMYESLEANCLQTNALPSIAYGFKSCSEKYKIRPQNKWLKAHPLAIETWAAGGVVTKLIGYDAGEERRTLTAKDKDFAFRFPLIEWGMEREDCIAAIQGVGLPLPGKSACFFCPSSRPHEVITLHRKHPDLMARALAMEANAELTTVQGLGRSWSWADLIRSERSQIDMFAVSPDMPCGCYDGDSGALGGAA